MGNLSLLSTVPCCLCVCLTAVSALPSAVPSQQARWGGDIEAARKASYALGLCVVAQGHDVDVHGRYVPTVLLTFSPFDAACRVKIITTKVVGRGSAPTSPLELDVGASFDHGGKSVQDRVMD